jgi:hypothetical protein
VAPRDARDHKQHSGVVSSSLDGAELTWALQPQPQPHRRGGATMPKLKLRELDRAGPETNRVGARDSRKMRAGMTLDDVTKLGRDAAAAVALRNAYGPGPPAHIQPQAKAHFFRVPHKQVRCACAAESKVWVERSECQRLFAEDGARVQGSGQSARG